MIAMMAVVLLMLAVLLYEVLATRSTLGVVDRRTQRTATDVLLVFDIASNAKGEIGKAVTAAGNCEFAVEALHAALPKRRTRKGKTET